MGSWPALSVSAMSRKLPIGTWPQLANAICPLIEDANQLQRSAGIENHDGLKAWIIRF